MALAKYLTGWAHSWAGLLCGLLSLLASHLSPMQLVSQDVLDLQVQVPLKTQELGLPCVRMLGD